MSGNLRVMVLKVLDEDPLSGYGIVKLIEEKTGWKPSYGSVYPLLDSMKEQGLLDMREEGRKKVYSLTKEGKKRMGEWDEKKEGLYRHLKENIKIMREITGKDHSVVLEMLDRFKKGEDPLHVLNPEIFEFRNKVFRMCFDGRAERNKKEIKQMLKTMTKKLEKMK